ncbi:protoheme IX farnesyltransferase [Parvularcula sp. ZS-1/3]|uniref:Protoheme IX farnesyltransferase n=2 Tax=Parvularcula mediterranea TaxID=2732508 RepID=A0A7Y3W5Y8_9PROT|nr:heme o synthase [Parvularcula mediterranea]NNU17003.1 protoheme IX farnesyltransferase [Parvularcula mediterranea]
MTRTTMSETATDQEIPAHLTAEPSDYAALLKPRVMSLSIFTALVGMVVAPGPVPSWGLAILSTIAIALGAGASAALNMWWDSDIDGLMARTAKRPIPQGKVPAAEAFGLGIVLSALSVWLLALSGGYLAAGLLAITIGFYVVVYSMFLKRRTPQNIVIGGAAGALPPVVGYAAVTGTVPLEAWALFALIFIWTPPHFWALSLLKKGDYEAAGVPMLPNVKGDAVTRREIWRYSILLVLTAPLIAFFPLAGWLYAASSIVLGAEFLRRAWMLRGSEDNKGAAGLFGFSILYLFALFLVLLVEHWAGFHG